MSVFVIRAVSGNLQLPESTIYKVLHKNLRLYAYKIQLLHAIKINDKPQRKEFVVTILQKFEDDFFNRICLRVRHPSMVLVRYNLNNTRIWGSENPNFTRKIERENNVQC